MSIETRIPSSTPPLARVQAKESVGLSTGRWNANPCENNRLIPNPSPWVLGSGRGGEFEERALSLNRSGLIWPGGWSLPGPVTNVEFGKDSHANWILVPRPRSLLLRCNFGLDGRGGRRRRGRGRWQGRPKWQARRGTMLMAGSFVATMRLLADIFHPREAMFAHRRVWNRAEDLGQLCTRSLASPFVFSRHWRVSSSVKSPMTSFRGIEKNRWKKFFTRDNFEMC